MVPAYNEEALVAHTVEHLVTTAPQWAEAVEIIVVDDGSTDATPGIIDDLAGRYPMVRAVHQVPNRGFGATVRLGFEHATQPYVMVCPSDYHFTLEDFDIYLALIKYADIVIGYRRHRRLDLPFRRRMVSAVYHLLVNALFRLNFYDVNWIHMYRRDQLPSFLGRSDGVFVLAENIIRANRLGLRIMGVDVNYTDRTAGVATGVKPRTIIATIRELLAFYARGEHRKVGAG